MKRTIASILLLLALPWGHRLCGQGIFTPGGQYGIGISADMMTQNGTNGTGATTGYSFGGIADIRFSAAHFWLGDKLGGENVSANQFTPSFSLYGTGGSPICALFRISYAIARYSSPALDTLHGTLNGNSASILTAVYTRVQVSPSVDLYPTLGLEYIEGTHNDDIGFNPSVSTSFSRTPFILDLPMAYSLPSGMLLIIEPALRVFPELAVQPSFTEFSISAGFIIPTVSPF